VTAVIPSDIQGIFAKTNLYFANNFNEWVPLPTWGAFFINIGRWVAQAETGKNRLVLALAIPTRNYAAALAALGVVLARANIPTGRTNTKRHFEQLCRLAKGTPVTFRYNGSRLKGIYQGTEKVDSEMRLRIQTENDRKGGLTHLVSIKECQNVAIAFTQNISLPKKQAGRRIVANNEFIYSLIGKVDPRKFSTKTRLECAVIGRFSILTQEIKEVPFACYSSKSKLNTGYLNDVLRVRKFLSEGEAYRSEVLPVHSDKPVQTANGLVPHVVIFDGATGFIKWRDRWRNSHWIILVERTEPRFQEAVTEINNEYGNRVDGEKIHNIPSVPFGVELVVYQEACQ
jgi:hypothetical protein